MEPDDEALKELAAASSRPPQRRGISYSQPVSRGDTGSARSAALHNHSLDDEHIHPLRETQAGSFLRTLAAMPQRRQLWAGAESGIRVWALDEVFAGWGAGARRGDEDREGVPAPPALCFAMDKANGLLWTGHKDSRIRSWRMDLETAATAPAPPPPGSGESVGGRWRPAVPR